VEEQSSGVYTPSPGMVYPALTYLEEMSYAVAAAEGTKKLYSITDEGTEHLGKHRAAATELWTQLAIFGRKLAHFRKQFAEEEDVADHFGSGPYGGAKRSGST
jgi:DNA-binding PadR family transcriptional regulator